MTTEQYIEREVKARIKDDRYKDLRLTVKRINNKMNLIIVLIVVFTVLRVVLHF